MYLFLSVLRLFFRKAALGEPPTSIESDSSANDDPSFDTLPVILRGSEVGRHPAVLHGRNDSHVTEFVSLPSQQACCCANQSQHSSTRPETERTPISYQRELENQTPRPCCNEESIGEDNLTKNDCKCVDRREPLQPTVEDSVQRPSCCCASDSVAGSKIGLASLDFCGCGGNRWYCKCHTDPFTGYFCNCCPCSFNPQPTPGSGFDIVLAKAYLSGHRTQQKDTENESLGLQAKLGKGRK